MKKDEKVIAYYSLILALLITFGIMLSANYGSETQEPIIKKFCVDGQENFCKDHSGVYRNKCKDSNNVLTYACYQNQCNEKVVSCSNEQVCEDGQCVTVEVAEPEKYNICSEGKCVEIEGSGSNECDTDNECYHNECVDMSCVTLNSKGENKCNVDSDCECICDSGTCCDGCYYRSPDYVCDSMFEVDYGCPWSTNCSSDVGIRYKIRYCSGESSWCNGEVSDWGNWSIYDECNERQLCIDGVAKCKYSSKCN